MPVTTVKLSPDVERDRRDRERWAETLAAVESAARGNVIAAEPVHEWLRGWGTDEETDAPACGP